MTEAFEAPTAVQDRPRLLGWLSLSALVVALDQLSKWLVTSNMQLGDQIPVWSVFSWVRWHNEGAAFSMLSDSGDWKRWFFVTLAIGFTGFIVYELRRLNVTDRFMAFVYALILGGALGNMVDRLFHGYVVDFILVHYQDWYFPAFNVADMALSCGAVLWIGFLLLEYRRTARRTSRRTKDSGESQS
jgi:signal peptidase II